MPTEPPIARKDITGLILAGGRGRRMDEADKGLVPWRGQPLVAHALTRLRPQVGALMVSANRHLDDYAAFGVPVHADARPGYAGPLAGVATGLAHAATPWVAVVPCDTPRLPLNLVARLADGLRAQQADLAVAVTRDGERLQHQSVFLLLPRRLHADLDAWLASGQARVRDWLQQHRCADVLFDEPQAFLGANTYTELEQLP